MKNVSGVLFEGTSFNCTGNTPQNKTCHFRNLCYSYSANVFVYIHSPNSEELSIEVNGREALSLLPLTTASGVNVYLRYINVTRNQLHLYEDNFIFRPGKYIIYSRFVANHVMFLFHNELIPLYFTLLRHFDESQFSSIKLFIKDEDDIKDFAVLYKKFSPHPPLLRYELGLELSETVTCFQEATIGLVRESIWYQYGLKEPGRPLKDPSVTAGHIRQFTTFLKQKLEIEPYCSNASAYGILLSRKKNRLLLNEKELQAAISDEFQIKMIELSLEHCSISFIIEKISCAKLVVGVHGALLVVTMFLPPTSMVMEIFPYAVNPNHRTAYRTLTQLPGMDIMYGCWRNMDKTKTVTQPFVHPVHGGISHLPPEEQERINNITEVPHNKFGSDPEWRFHLFQDTIVDIPAVIDTMKDLGFEYLLKS
ncbi:Protein O-linked-mannose beta-1,4-N-acetylglucosaminyltransferase 2 [Holothuria leucospilota]|uniref:Protein O-linked-mannose beta-1,4-N-acetylglucosaminyltransferase 2 n=1 Tax=Holothuria leucospilota TaxID=206669 RepID=A0A9Q1CDQ1_HOLLE|nr:Protein O-linked-mannose beta-1,4-N-acetylglucosaminyltransferase 2 [Holothuria leucospilota]